MRVYRSKRGNAGHPLIESAEPVSFGIMRIWFDDGYEADLDLRDLMKHPNWSEIQTYDDFAGVEVSEYGGHLSWPRFEDVPELPADGCREECERQKQSNAH
jgi:uncharacterized protein DUF2442